MLIKDGNHAELICSGYDSSFGSINDSFSILLKKRNAILLPNDETEKSFVNIFTRIVLETAFIAIE